MRWVLPILLATVVATAGVPHALCACGCSWLGPSQTDAATRNPGASCPHCCGHPTQEDGDGSSPADPDTCDCRSCDERLAVVPQSVASGQLSSSDRGKPLVDAALSLPVVSADPISPRAGGPAFSSFALPVRALPILLGHLLL